MKLKDEDLKEIVKLIDEAYSYKPLAFNLDSLICLCSSN